MRATLKSAESVASGTMLFRFQKPESFTHRAGQSIDLTIPAGTHAFSLVSAPHEDHLAIATRMRGSEYKNALETLAVGSEVEMEGPFGSFFLHQAAERPAVFLVGGIGVTAFYSMIKDAFHRSLPHTIYMVYANRTSADAPFVKELEALAVKHQHFKLKLVYGVHVDAPMVQAFAPVGQNPIYYMAGPQGMVSAMRTLVNGLGVSDDDIKFEEFTGY